MSVTEVTYWKGDKPDQVISIAREAKGILTRHGATIVELNRVHAGPEVGQWAAVIGFSGWKPTAGHVKLLPMTLAIRHCSRGPSRLLK